MKLEQQRIVIAEFCGYRIEIENTQGRVWVNPQGLRGTEWFDTLIEKDAECPPDYPNDLNAMHEAEERLRKNQFHFVNYPEILFGLVSGTKISNGLGYFTFNFIHAKADERAEALLKTIGKWED